MIANVKIDLSNPMAIGFLQYARTLPFAIVDDGEQSEKFTQSAWQQAINEGAMTVDEFVGEMKARIAKWPDENA
jgi:hypothetical protein